MDVVTLKDKSVTPMFHDADGMSPVSWYAYCFWWEVVITEVKHGATPTLPSDAVKVQINGSSKSEVQKTLLSQCWRHNGLTSLWSNWNDSFVFFQHVSLIRSIVLQVILNLMWQQTKKNFYKTHWFEAEQTSKHMYMWHFRNYGNQISKQANPCLFFLPL